MAGSISPRRTPRTPKRKWIDLAEVPESPVSEPAYPYLNNTVFSFEPPGRLSAEFHDEGNNSPRTKVAQKLRDLSIEDADGRRGGGGGQPITTSQTAGDGMDNENIQFQRPQYSPEPVVFDFNGARQSRNKYEAMKHVEEDNDEGSIRKRAKHAKRELQITPGNHGEASAEATGPVQVDERGKLTLQSAVDPAMVNTTENAGIGKLQQSYPSINRLADSKSRRRKRSGTPPLTSRRKKLEAAEEDEPEIIDPVRAALTWHEDEITVYDSEDKDDDGTGLNGIGFKPTPAIAYARAQKRRQQLAEYRKREDAEARARRNQRRREQLGVEGTGMQRKHSMVRVRFSDANSVVTS